MEKLSALARAAVREFQESHVRILGKLERDGLTVQQTIPHRVVRQSIRHRGRNLGQTDAPGFQILHELINVSSIRNHKTLVPH
jgi:hypothetical protein